MSKKVLITSRSFGKISNEPLDILTGAGFEVTMKGKDFDLSLIHIYHRVQSGGLRDL